MQILLILRTLLSYFLGLIAAAIFLPIAIIILILPEKIRPTKLFFFLLYLFYEAILRCFLMPIKIIGKENLLKNKAVIFVANHQSALDIPLVGILSQGQPHLWLVLEYYQNKLILGFFIKKLFITVNQQSKLESAKSLIKAIRKLLDSPQNLVIFPEGGRFIDGKIHRFFEGFAVITQKTNYPVIPVYLVNNAKIYPPFSFLMYYHEIKAIVGKPIFMESNETPKDFTKRVHNWFEEQLEGK